MPKTLAELLADANAADDLQFTGPDGTVFKLADLRTFSRGVQTETAAAKAKREEAERLAQEAATILGALEKANKENQPQPDRRESKPPSWEEDALYAPLVPVVKELRTIAETARAESAALKKSLDTSQAIYALERMRRQWAEAKTKPKDKKFEEVVAEVLASKELDEMGLPTLDKYLYRTGEPDRIQAAVTEAVQKAEVEWEKKHRAANIPKPGRFQTRKAPDKPPISKIEDLTTDVVANDPEIVAAWEGETIQ